METIVRYGDMFEASELGEALLEEGYKEYVIDDAELLAIITGKEE